MFILLLLANAVLADVWLPKCCPSGKQIGPDKSCVDDDVLVDFLNVTVDNKNVSYRLEHRANFTCDRHELLVVQDNLEVTDDGQVMVTLDERWTLELGELCVDTVSVGVPGLDRVYVALLCPDCRRVRCLHKCCPDSQELRVSGDGSAVDCVAAETPWTQDQHKSFVFHGFPECDNQLYLEYTSAWDMDIDGDHLRLRGARVPRAHYCVDRSPDGTALLACRLAPSLKPAVYGGLFVLGAVFLGVTLALHLWLPELRKSLHARVLVAHVACLLVGYVGLAVVNLAPLPAPSCACSATAFTIQFSILAAMFWLNIMCVDIAWTFSGLRAPKASQTLDSDGHKFLYYSLFAWGGSAAISGVTAFLEFSPVVPHTSKFKPSFGITRCWFER